MTPSLTRRVIKRFGLQFTWRGRPEYYENSNEARDLVPTHSNERSETFTRNRETIGRRKRLEQSKGDRAVAATNLTPQRRAKSIWKKIAGFRSVFVSNRGGSPNSLTLVNR